MRGLEEKLGYTFKNRSLLKKAVTHSSYANENRAQGECNERLEFLGDSILGFVVADYLYNKFPGLPEGKMTRLRAEMVCEENLAVTAKSLELGKYLLLGKGEELGGGRTRPSINADAVESLLAAVYLDGGLAEASRLIYTHIIDRFPIKEHKTPDSKTMLQELVQEVPGRTLKYVLKGESGPDHKKVFTVAAVLDDVEISVGSAGSKKAAEQEAARLALEKLS